MISNDPPQAPITWRRSPSPAGSIVVRFYRGERRGAERTCRRLFGRELCEWEYAGLAGGPWGGVVEVGVLGEALYLETHTPATHHWHAVQRVRRGRDGPVLVNDASCIPRRELRGRGLGRRLFLRQLLCAGRLGLRRIETTAGRRGGENGYYTWPRFGFDGPLAAETRRALPPPLAAASTVVDLIESAPGRQWWRRHGATIDVAFDLREGSRSWAVFARYLLERPSTACAAL